MARDEQSFSNCHYSFLNRILQPFHRHPFSQTTLQVNALVDSKLKKVLNNDKHFSKSTVDLNNMSTVKGERMSIRQIGQFVADMPSSQPVLNRPSSIGVVTKPRLSGV